LSNVIQLRKEPRATTTVQTGTVRRTWQISTTHVSPFVQKILGLTRGTTTG
jgi:hypothetical protein